jgi:hypothetical protein
MAGAKTDNLKLGQLIDSPQERDAIHVAVAPVEAAEDLSPGQHIGIRLDGRASSKGTAPIGIVDPFLKAKVPTGKRFWLFLYPYTIQSLRHHWEHPAFDGRQP